MPDEEKDKDKDKDKGVTPIWSRLEKILEKVESTSSSSASSQVDVVSLLNLKLQLEKTALELSISTITENGRTISFPPNILLAEKLSDYLCSRMGLPAKIGK